jgi:hypothetical protein
MAKRAGKSSQTGKKKVTFGKAMRELQRVGVEKQQFGRMRGDGTHSVDSKHIEKMKQKVGKAAWSRVRFVALNAPFKRRSPISPT